MAYSRGQVRILDVQGLGAVACECYQIVQQEFVRLLGSSSR